MLRMTLLRLMLPLLLAAPMIMAATASAQFHEPDAAALEAFETMIRTYRERPGYTVRTTLEIDLVQDDIRAHSGEVEAEFTIGRNRHGVVRIRGFNCYLTPGTIAAVHEDNDEAYFRSSDHGSSYYALTAAFIDLPFPHLAIAFGADDPLDLCMQFHPKAPWSRPTGVETITKVFDEDDENAEQETVTLIRMTSDHENMRIYVDPETQFIRAINLRITGGHLAREGVTIVYSHAFEYETHDKEEIKELLAFDPGDRRSVDTLAALLPRRTAGTTGRRGVGGGLTGGEAPPLTLPTMDGEVFDLREHRGRIVILDFWATWCRPCLRILPELHKIQMWATKENLPVTIMTVNVWEIPDADQSTPERRLEQAKAFWERHEFTLHVAMDFNDEIAAAYRLQGIPTTIVIRADGVVHLEHVGTDNYGEVLRRAIRNALAETEF